MISTIICIPKKNSTQTKVNKIPMSLDIIYYLYVSSVFVKNIFQKEKILSKEKNYIFVDLVLKVHNEDFYTNE